MAVAKVVVREMEYFCTLILSGEYPTSMPCNWRRM